MSHCVYLLTNTANGKQYVGLTKDFAKRMAYHRSRKSSCRFLARAVRRHGWDAFRQEILETGLDLPTAKARETHWIATLGTKCPSGYNLTDGGEGNSRVVTGSARRKASARMAALWSTPEYRERLSAAHRGRTISDETRRKMSEAQKVAQANPDTRAKRAQARIRRAESAPPKPPPPPRAPRVSPKKGTRLSAEHRARISATMMGVPYTPERKAQARIKKAAAVALGCMRKKLTIEAAADIKRRLYRGEKKTHIAAIHGVSGTQIHHIAKGRQWAHVTVEEDAST